MRFLRVLLIIGIMSIHITPSGADVEVYPIGDYQDGGVEAAERVYLSLNEVLNLALVNNFDIQLNLYDRNIKEADMDEEKSIYDTVLTLTGEYDYDRREAASTILGTSSHSGSAGVKLTKKLITGTDVTIDWQNVRESSDSAFASMNPSYESSLEMKFTQPLLKNFFGMNDWGEVRITRIDIDNFSSQTLDKIEKKLADVERAYWDLVAAKGLVKIRREMCSKADEFYRINKEKKELGTSELTDLLAAEANRKRRKSELEVEEDNLKYRMNNLKLLIDYSKGGADILPVDNMGVLPRDIIFIQNLKTAFENRRDYQRAKNEIKAKRIKFNMKRNSRWPQLDFEGSLKLNGVERMYKSSAAEAFTHENPEYYAKATFSFPFEDRESRSEYNKAKYEKLKSLLSLKKTEKTIVTEIDDKVRKVNVYRQKALRDEEIEALQREKLKDEERLFGYGRSDSDRIIRFQEDLLNAEISALMSLREYKDSLIDLYIAQNTFIKKRGLTVQ